jgi:phosphopentomutase
MENLGDDDMLVITADHGCDPGDVSTDHTREYTPLLVWSKGVDPVDLGVRESFADIAASVEEFFGIRGKISGKSFLKAVKI